MVAMARRSLWAMGFVALPSPSCTLQCPAPRNPRNTMILRYEKLRSFVHPKTCVWLSTINVSEKHSAIVLENRTWKLWNCCMCFLGIKLDQSERSAEPAKLLSLGNWRLRAISSHTVSWYFCVRCVLFYLSMTQVHNLETAMCIVVVFLSSET